VNFLTIGTFYGTDDLYDEIWYAAVLSYFQTTNFWVNKTCLHMQGITSHVRAVYSARAFSLGTSGFVFVTLRLSTIYIVMSY